jgi:hypothetical protein
MVEDYGDGDLYVETSVPGTARFSGEDYFYDRQTSGTVDIEVSGTLLVNEAGITFDSSTY